MRGQFLLWTGLMVTDPHALAAICGRGQGALDKAASFYAPINYVRLCITQRHMLPASCYATMYKGGGYVVTCP